MSKHKMMFYVNETNISKVMLFNILLVYADVIKNIQKIVLHDPLNCYLQ